MEIPVRELLEHVIEAPKLTLIIGRLTLKKIDLNLMYRYDKN